MQEQCQKYIFTITRGVPAHGVVRRNTEDIPDPNSENSLFCMASFPSIISSSTCKVSQFNAYRFRFSYDLSSMR